MDQEQTSSQESETLDPHCFACDMPMKKEEEFGTNTDGSKNEQYCCHCLQNGERK